jgi:hypothetical protein
MKAIGRGGGEGWDKEEGEGEGRREAHPPVFSNTPPPQFELSGNKPAAQVSPGGRSHVTLSSGSNPENIHANGYIAE